MSERRVEIKNFSNGDLVYNIPSRSVRRVFSPNMKMKVPFEELQEGLCMYGIRYMFESGLLACTNDQDAIDLQLLDAPKAADLKTSDDIKKILVSGDNSAIYLLMKNATRESQTDIINVIIANNLYDSNIVKWCKEFFDYDILPALQRANEA